MTGCMARERLLIIASLLVVCLVWGSTYFAIRVGLETLPPFLMAGARFVLAGGLLYAGLRWTGAEAPTREEWKNAAIVGVLLCTAGNGLVTFAQQWVSSSLAAVVVATIPLWTAIFAARAGMKPSPRERAALALGFAGVVVLNIGGELAASGALGAVSILAAPIAWAYGSSRALTAKLPSGSMAPAAQMLVGGAGLLLVSMLVGERAPAVISARSFVAFGYLVVFGSILGFSAYGYLLKRTGPTVATSYAYVNPLVAMVLGASFAGESLGVTTAVASALIVTSVAMLKIKIERRLGVAALRRS